MDVFRDFLGGEIKGERRRKSFCDIEYIKGSPAKRSCLADTATVNRINTTTILTGLENLPIREKALWKAEELLVGTTAVESGDVLLMPVGNLASSFSLRKSTKRSSVP